MLEQNRTARSAAVVGQNGWPNRVLRVRQIGDDPEALVGMMDDRDVFACHWSDRPVVAQEVQRVVRVETALVVEGEVKVHEWHRRSWAKVGAVFPQGQVPGGIGSQTRGAANMMFIVPEDLGLEESIGVFEVGDSFVGQESDQSLLEGVEAAFDLAFGGCVRSDPVRGAQGGEGALKLRMGVQPVGGRTMAKQRETVGVKAGAPPVGFDGLAQMGKMAPSRVRSGESGRHDFSGMIIDGEDECGVRIGGPPRMGRAVVLPQFANGAGLPTAARFGAGRLGGNQFGEVVPDMGGDGRAGAVEVKSARQLIGQQGKIEGLTMGQAFGQKIMGLLRPNGAVIATGGLKLKAFLVRQPLVAQLIELSATDH